MLWRWLVCGCIWLSLAAGADPALEVVRTTLTQTDGGPSDPPGFTHIPGEVLFFTFDVAGFRADADQKVRVSYTVDALDPAGVRIMETVSNQIEAELTPQDKEWRPRVRMEIPLPPLAPSGTYKLVVKATDLQAKTTTGKTIAFEIRGHEVEPSPTVIVRNFHFYRNEEDVAPLARAVYHPGDPVWARFDIIGYQFGPKNAVDVAYGIAILNAEGKQLWAQPEAAVERSDSFYPRRYVAGAMGINLQKNINPGDYTIQVTVKDAIGGKSFDDKFTFTVEK